MKRTLYQMLLGLLFVLGSGIHSTWANPIAFSCLLDGGNLEICTINSDGTGHRNLTNSTNANEFYPTWSPDRTQIVFMGSGGGAASLYFMNSNGGNVTLLKKNHWARTHPTWSPDGMKIAYGGVDSFYIFDLRTKVQKNVRISAPHLIRDMSWSPDGHRLAFSSLDQRQIYAINVDGTNLRELTSETDIPHSHNRSPAWSPDGQQIAFSSSRNESGGIFLMDADGGNVRELTNGGEGFPSWSPDGSQIAFSVAGYIGVIDADGNNLKLLTEGYSPSWQPTFPGVTTPVSPVERGISVWGAIKSDQDLRIFR